MQVLDRDETELPFDGPTVFHDIEGEEELFAEPGRSGSRIGRRCGLPRRRHQGVRRPGLRPRPLLHR